MKDAFDVLIIGAGAVGSAVARELARFQLRIGVLEKELDVCCETSGRNSGVLHAGFNNCPGSLMARFCVEGNRLFNRISQELAIPFQRTGKLVVGFDTEDKKRLEALKETGDINQVPGLEIVDKDRIAQLAPGIGGEWALWSPSTGIFDPFQLTIGLAENAAENGVQFFLGQCVQEVSYEDEVYTVYTDTDEFKGRWLINCAGLGSVEIAALLGIREYTIHPCRGEYYILDQRAGNLLPLPVYPVPNPKAGGLGVHLTPTIDGNILIGPSNEYIDSGVDYSTTRPVMNQLLEEGGRIFPHLSPELFIRNFAGIRPKLTEKTEGGYHDFVIECSEAAPNSVHLIGIESPGMTSAVPIAKHVAKLIEAREAPAANLNFNPIRKSIIPFRKQSPERQAELIRQNPDYGEIVCRCESITKAEVLAALNNPLGVDTVTGIKYRCRTMMGRCQGGYCQTRITELIMQEKQKKREELLYNRKGSYLFTGEVREL